MPRIKLVHKGLILVGVPLLFGIAYISLLCYGLSEANRLVQRKLLFKDAIISYVTASRCSAAARLFSGVYMSNQDPFFSNAYIVNKRQATAANKHLKALLKNVGSLKIPPLQLSFKQLYFSDKQADDFSAELQKLSDAQTKSALSAMNLLQSILIGGMAAGALVSIALAVFFCLNITNRLLIIVGNTINLSRGTNLSLPLKGNDEIAELDQLLYDSANKIMELERFKKEMIGVVSHELKSPLSSIGAFLSSLGEGVYGELAAKAKDKVNRTYSSVKRLMGLVGELLLLDRLELDLSPEEITVDALVAGAVDTVKELSEKSGIQIIANSCRGKIFADRDRLVQVTVNLLSNAMKFSPPNGQVTLTTTLNDAWFECRVSDQGRGIPEAFRRQIFEPFKQVDAKDATTKKGTGLGLTISRSIVEQHGGEIGVDSEEGKGSTFWFKIPISSQSRQEKAVAGNVPIKSSNGSFLPSKTKEVSARSGSLGKFRVLHQGLCIISIPLVCQMAFATVIGLMLQQVREQTRQEEKFREIVDSLNRGGKSVSDSLRYGVMYVVTVNPSLLKSWEDGKFKALNYIDHATRLSVSDPQQARDVKIFRDALDKTTSTLHSEVSKGLLRERFLQDMDNSVRERFCAVMGIDTKGNVTGLTPSMSALGGEDGLGGMDMEMIGQLRVLLAGECSVKLAKIFIEAMEAQNKLMEREKAQGEKLSVQRTNMIKTLEQTLFAGIVLNVILSTILAITLMRSLTSRLHHVMENTERLVRRAPLDPPKKGADEIAYLDRVLFETGNRLVELEAFKRQLISIVSHELRTPLMSIASALELFEAGVLGDLSEKGNKRLKFAQEETDRLIRLINDLLDIEKMEAGKFVLDLTETRVSAPVNTAISAIGQLAEIKQIKVEAEIKDPDLILHIDRDRISQVIINLLSNAIKYSPQKGTITIRIEADDDGQIRTCVIDQGRGIPEELRQKVFDRFVQVEKSDATEKGGSGLGLAISKAIVEQHGGTIGVDSQMGVGSSFWFKLPPSRWQAPGIS